jgi:hypothetical protein
MSSSTRSFIRHYLEMIAAMFLGMAVLYVPAEALLGVVVPGSGEVQDEAPAALLLAMAVIMTLPMVGWMVHRGHSARPCVEMSAAMFVPTFGVIALMPLGLVSDFGTLMGLEHVVMLPAMLLVMLLRPEEYTGHHHHHQQQAVAAG